MDQCQIVVTQIGSTSHDEPKYGAGHALDTCSFFNVLKPVAWSKTHHGSVGGIVRIRGWVG